MANKGVSTKNFVNSMVSRWVDFGVVPNEPLKVAWKTMVTVLNRHINGKIIDKWDVLKLPTGSGKTQGLIVYCSELAKVNTKSGVLIVTRFTDEADNLAKEINKRAGKKIAHAKHSKNKSNKVNPEDAQILIVTHSLFSGGLKVEAGGDYSSVLNRIYKYQNNSRVLTVIDETLATVDHDVLNINDLRIMRGAIPYEIEKKYEPEISRLDFLLDKLYKYAVKDEDASKYIMPPYYSNERQVDVNKHLNPLYQALSEYHYKPTKLNEALYQENLKVLNLLITMLTTDGIYINRFRQHEFHTANISLPTDIKNVVVLDATAKQCYAYDLLGHFVDVHEMPKGVRSYQNVSLNIFYGSRVGKSFMVEQNAEYFLKLMDYLSLSSKNENILLCVHKGVNDDKHKLSLVKKKYPNISTEHWGNIDGKNDWKDYDSIILCGLSSLSNIGAECAVMAFDRWHQKSSGINNPKQEFIEDDNYEGGGYIYRHEELDDHIDYSHGHLAVGVIQALNRVRCRSSMDTDGNCDPVNAYLFLNKRGGTLEKHVLNSIREEMPNINIIEHDIDVDEKLTLGEESIIEFFSNLDNGEYPLKGMKESVLKAGVTRRTFERYRPKINKEPNSLFSKTVAGLGINYIVERGKHGRTRFIKS